MGDGRNNDKAPPQGAEFSFEFDEDEGFVLDLGDPSDAGEKPAPGPHAQKTAEVARPGAFDALADDLSGSFLQGLDDLDEPEESVSIDIDIDMEEDSTMALDVRALAGLGRKAQRPPAPRPAPPGPRQAGARYAAAAPPPPQHRRAQVDEDEPAIPGAASSQDTADDLSAAFLSADPLSHGRVLTASDVPAPSTSADFDPWADLDDAPAAPIPAPPVRPPSAPAERRRPRLADFLDDDDQGADPAPRVVTPPQPLPAPPAAAPAPAPRAPVPAPRAAPAAPMSPPVPAFSFDFDLESSAAAKGVTEDSTPFADLRGGSGGGSGGSSRGGRKEVLEDLSDLGDLSSLDEALSGHVRAPGRAAPPRGASSSSSSSNQPRYAGSVSGSGSGSGAASPSGDGAFNFMDDFELEFGEPVPAKRAPTSAQEQFSRAPTPALRAPREPAAFQQASSRAEERSSPSAPRLQAPVFTSQPSPPSPAAPAAPAVEEHSPSAPRPRFGTGGLSSRDRPGEGAEPRGKAPTPAPTAGVLRRLPSLRGGAGDEAPPAAPPAPRQTRAQAAPQSSYARLIGLVSSLDRVPRLRVSPGKLTSLKLDSRGGFLLSQIDGQITFDELLELNILPREETLDLLCELVSAGVIAV